jgi:hypothetical protein
VCRHLISVDLTCKKLQIPISERYIEDNAGVSKKDYKEAFRISKNLMDYNFEKLISISVLSIKYNLNDIVPDATNLLNRYKSKHQHSISDMETSLTHCAAFYTAIKRRKVSISIDSVNYFL